MGHKNFKEDDVAIIGMSGRFSEAENLENFWSNLISAKESVKEFPVKRKEELKEILSKIPEIDFTRGGYINNVTFFEPELFSISREESKYIDPQHRLLIELVEGALLDAGYNPEKLMDQYVGVFIAENRHNYIGSIYGTSPMAMVNSMSSSGAGRIAYTYNFRGPVLTIGTACSSSLVTLHYACQSIKSGEVEMAIVGGVELMLLPMDKKEANRISILSEDQKVRAFDKDAQGTVFGEGGGVVFLKLAKKAFADGDNILAVIKGSAVNSDGNWSNGMMSPSEHAQSEVILKAIENAQIDSLSISYIETHGTGTKIGDPIEIAAIQKVFDKFGYKKQSVPVGSLKSNIGHLNGAAGIASVIKTVLALQKKQIPASINFDYPNPLIDFINSPIYINDKLSDWNSNIVRRAGVTSLGLTGTNCHLILEEAPKIVESSFKNCKNIIMLSARTKKSLKAMTDSLRDYIEKNKDVSIDDLAFTLNNGRRRLQNVFLTIAEDIEEFKNNLTIFANDSHQAENSFLYYLDQDLKVSPIFIFPDLNYTDFLIYTRLYSEHVVYQKYFHECIEKLTDKEDLDNKKIQYLIYSYSCIKLLASYSIKPKAVFGIGIGQIISNLASEKISFKEALLQVKAYDKVEKEIKEDGIRNVVNKIIKSGIDMFLIFSPNQVLSNLFTEILNEKRKMFYEIYWKQKELQNQDKIDKKGAVLVFKDERGIGEKLALEMKTEGRRVIEVELGSEYRKISETNYIISGTENDYQNLFQEMKDKNLAEIFHLLTITNQKEIETLEDLTESQKRGVYSLFNIIKVLHENEINKLEITLLSESVNLVNNREEQINSHNASLFGLAKAIRKEYPQISCRCIDIDLDFTIEHLRNELMTVNEEMNVAYRNGQRYVQEFQTVDLKTIAEEEVQIKEEGVYIITGGCGGIGLEIGKYLASKNKVNLALLNRASLPAVEKWEQILKENKNPKLSHKLRSIKEMQAYNAEVLCYSVDVSNLEEMKIVLNELRSKYGKINGIIHSAGIAGDGIILTKDRAVFEQVLSPKIYGTWNMHYLTMKDDLDFLILFSSTASIIGGAGQGDYIAANSYLDSFSAYRNSLGKRTITINWSSWKETGMARDFGVNFDKVFKTIPTNLGIDAFDKVLHKKLSKVIIGEANFDLIRAYKEHLPFEISDEVKELLEKGNSKPTSLILLNHKNDSFYWAVAKCLENGQKINWEQVYQGQNRKRLSLPGYIFDRKSYFGKPDRPIFSNDIFDESKELVDKNIKNHENIESIFYTMLSEVSVDSFTINDYFMDLDMDSIGVMHFVGKIRKKFYIEVPLKIFFNNNKISEIFTLIKESIISTSVKQNIIERQPEKEIYPVSAAQRRLFVLNRLIGNSTSYNLPAVISIKGKLDRERFIKTIQLLVKRHESLRTSFELVDGDPVQRLHSEVDFQVQEYRADEFELKRIIKQFIQPFDLSKAPLLRV